MTSSRDRTAPGTSCGAATNASVDVMSAAQRASARSAAISSSPNATSASKATIGTTGSPRSAANRAAAPSAPANGPPGSAPARSALFNTTTAGTERSRSARSSSGLSASAMTRTCASAPSTSGVTTSPAPESAVATWLRPTPGRPVTATLTAARTRLSTVPSRPSPVCAAYRASTSAKMCRPRSGLENVQLMHRNPPTTGGPPRTPFSGLDPVLAGPVTSG